MQNTLTKISVWLVASVLVIAGILKAVSNMPPRSFFQEIPSAHWVHVFAVQFEIYLGLWLILAKNRVPPLVVSTVVFFGFVILNIHDVMQGVAKCGCFGDLPITPRFALFVDLAAIALLILVLIKKIRDTQNSAKQIATDILKFALLQLMLATSYTIFLAVTFSRTEIFLSSVSGKGVVVSPSDLPFGNVPEGSQITKSLRIFNISNRSITITGGTADCSCVATTDLPLVISPSGYQDISVSFRAPETSGLFRREAYLWTDVEDQQVITVVLSGLIVKPK
jgi:Protein of unknown function (DUF1573)